MAFPQLFARFVLFWLRRIVRNKANEKAKHDSIGQTNMIGTNATPVITQTPVVPVAGQPIGYSITGILGIPPNAGLPPPAMTISPTGPDTNKRKRDDVGKSEFSAIYK